MKNLFPLCFVILFALTGCKSSDVDPRDQYIGDYDITSTYYNPAGSGPLGSTKSSSRTDNEKINLSKSTKDATFLISSAQAANVISASLKDDATFVLAPIYETLSYINNTSYQLTTTGEGRFINSQIKIVITRSAPALGLNQTVNVVGTKR